jgi:hypothetical protein
VSVKIPSSPPKIAQNRQEPTAPVGQKGPAAKAEAPSHADTPAAHSTDSFERTSAQSARQQEFDKKLGATSQGVIKQTSADNCGPAAALMAAGVKPGGSAAKEMAELKAKFTDGAGTTTQEMSQMLAHEGVAVDQGHYKYDQATVDQTLSKGGKMLAQVDSNQINPGANKQGAGSSHWVLIDGKDSQGNYQVKDPGTGTAYDIDFSKLSNAIDQNWVQHNAGGMMLLGNAEGSGSAAALARNNLANISTAPNSGGGSSSGGMAKIARESA